MRGQKSVDRWSVDEKLDIVDALAFSESQARALPEPKPYVPQNSNGLTPREIQVAGLVAQGLPNRKIAKRLGISEHTAQFHIDNLLRKLDVDRRTGIATYAVRAGIA